MNLNDKRKVEFPNQDLLGFSGTFWDRRRCFGGVCIPVILDGWDLCYHSVALEHIPRMNGALQDTRKWYMSQNDDDPIPSVEDMYDTPRQAVVGTLRKMLLDNHYRQCSVIAEFVFEGYGIEKDGYVWIIVFIDDMSTELKERVIRDMDKYATYAELTADPKIVKWKGERFL